MTETELKSVVDMITEKAKRGEPFYIVLGDDKKLETGKRLTADKETFSGLVKALKEMRKAMEEAGREEPIGKFSEKRKGYILQKDLMKCKAGEIFEPAGLAGIHYASRWKDENGQSFTFPKGFVENNPEWFEEKLDMEELTKEKALPSHVIISTERLRQLFKKTFPSDEDLDGSLFEKAFRGLISYERQYSPGFMFEHEQRPSQDKVWEEIYDTIRSRASGSTYFTNIIDSLKQKYFVFKKKR